MKNEAIREETNSPYLKCVSSSLGERMVGSLRDRSLQTEDAQYMFGLNFSHAQEGKEEVDPF